MEVLHYLHEDQRTGFQSVPRVQALVENQIGNQIRVLRTNNGSEYTSKEFMEFCAGEGIKRELRESRES
jgi:transposase InsO family protein